jgi:CheY-like chemotaxis protein/PAS domain-containing protein
MIRLRDLGKRDVLRLSIPYAASIVVIGAVFLIQDSFLRNLAGKVLSVFQRDTRSTAETLARMAMEDESRDLFEALPVPDGGSLVLRPDVELMSLLRLETASVVFGAGGEAPQPRDSLEDAAVESGELVSRRFGPGDRGGTWLIQAVYPVTGAGGGVVAFSSVTLVEPYSIRWLEILRYAMIVLFAVVLALVIFPRMLFDLSEFRRQKELDSFDRPEGGEAAVRESPSPAELLRTALVTVDLTAGVPSLLLSGDGTILYMSQSAGTLFDVSREEGEGRKLDDLPSVKAGGPLPDLSGGKPVEADLVHASGEKVRVWLGSMEVDPGGGGLRVAVASETASAGAGPRRAGILRREAPLTGSIAVISAMIRGFSHELNNLVGGIIGASSVGERMHDSPGPDRERYRSIIAEATKASRIIRELRESTTPRAGESGNRIDIRTELTEISEALRGVLPGSTSVSFDCSTGAVVEARSVVLRQLVYSLAIGSGNRARGPVRFSIIAAETDREEAGALFGEDIVQVDETASFVRVSLSDGSVMPEGIRECFLDPMADPVRVQESLGASVATALQAVQRLSVPVAFSPSPGGTVMHLLFRRIPAFSGERAAAALGGRSGKGVSVLVAEDVALVRESLQEILSHMGFSVKGASDGDEALAVLERQRFDVLMLDLSMPGTPSLDVARRCRSRWPGLAIILTSGYDPGDYVVRAMEEMEIPFVAKPYLPEDVATRILDALSNTGSPGDGEEGGGSDG